MSSWLEPSMAQEGPLRVITFVDEPFVMKSNDVYSGFHAELWQAIANEANLDYQMVEASAWSDLIVAVEQGDADIAIQHIDARSSHEAAIDYTHSVFDHGMQILVSGSTRKVLSIVRPLFSRNLLWLMGTAVFIVLIVAHLAWLLERRHDNSEFNQGYLKGIAEACWWAVVTFTTVGYGDSVPRTTGGRIIAVGWMILSLFLVSLFVAEFSSALTVQNLTSGIDDISDLKGQRIGTWPNSQQFEYLTDANLSPITFSRTDALVTNLNEGKLDAILVDTGIAAHYVDREGLLTRAGSPLSTGEIAYPVASNSPYLETINRAILRIRENGTYDEIYNRWLGIP